MVSELIYIKKVQRDFKEKFGKDLPVNFTELKGLNSELLRWSRQNRGTIMTDKEMLNFITSALDKYSAYFDNLKNEIITIKKFPNEHKAFTEISSLAVNNMWNLSQLSRLINKDRSTIYYHAKRNKVL